MSSAGSSPTGSAASKPHASASATSTSRLTTCSSPSRSRSPFASTRLCAAPVAPSCQRCGSGVHRASDGLSQGRQCRPGPRPAHRPPAGAAHAGTKQRPLPARSQPTSTVQVRHRSTRSSRRRHRARWPQARYGRRRGAARSHAIAFAPPPLTAITARVGEEWMRPITVRASAFSFIAILPPPAVIVPSTHAAPHARAPAAATRSRPAAAPAKGGDHRDLRQPLRRKEQRTRCSSRALRAPRPPATPIVQTTGSTADERADVLRARKAHARSSRHVDPQAAVIARAPLIGGVESSHRDRLMEAPGREHTVELILGGGRRLSPCVGGGNVARVGRQPLWPVSRPPAIRILGPHKLQAECLHPVKDGALSEGERLRATSSVPQGPC